MRTPDSGHRLLRWARYAAVGGVVTAAVLAVVRAIPAASGILSLLPSWIDSSSLPFALAAVSTGLYAVTPLAAHVSGDTRRFNWDRFAALLLVTVALGLVLLVSGVASRALLALSADRVAHTREPVLVMDVDPVQLPSPFTPAGDSDFWAGVVQLERLRNLAGAGGGPSGYYLGPEIEDVQGLIGSGEATDALSASQRLTQLDREGAASQLMRAKALYQQGHLDAAIEAVSRSRAVAQRLSPSGSREAMVQWADAFAAYYYAAKDASHGAFTSSTQHLLSYAHLRLDTQTPERIRSDPRFAGYRGSSELSVLTAGLSGLFGAPNGSRESTASAVR